MFETKRRPLQLALILGAISGGVAICTAASLAVASDDFIPVELQLETADRAEALDRRRREHGDERVLYRAELLVEG